MKKIIGLAMCAVLALAACSGKLTGEQLMKIKSGMSEAEVKNILGRPSSVEKGETLGVRKTVYHYSDGKNKAQIIFVNNQVVNKAVMSNN